ncbi:hypothetical protein PCE1_001979 [Barthelona sp. PCE]
MLLTHINPQKSYNNVPKCSFVDSEFWLSQCDDRTWKITSFSKNTGLFTHAQLDPEISSLISDALPFGKAFMACCSIYGALGVVSSNSGDGVCETHYRTFKHDDDGIQILNQVVVPEVHTHISVFDRAMGAITTNQSVLMTYMILKNGLLVDETEHKLPFPITSFIMCPQNWVIATKQLHLNDSVVGLFNLESEEQALLPYIVASLDVSITVNNSFTFDACNVIDRNENVFISLSFPSIQLYTMSTSNIEIDNTIQKSMNMTAKPGGITAPANTEDCEILPVIDISAPSAPVFHTVDNIPVYFEHESHTISKQNVAVKNEVHKTLKQEEIPEQPKKEVEVSMSEIDVKQRICFDSENDYHVSLLVVESEMLCIELDRERFCTELRFNDDFDYIISGNSEGAVICEYSGTSGMFYSFKTKNRVLSYTHCFKFDVTNDLPSIGYKDRQLIMDGHGKYFLLCLALEGMSYIYVYDTSGIQLYTERERHRIKNLYVNNEYLGVDLKSDDIVHAIITDRGFKERKQIKVNIDYIEIRPFRSWIVFKQIAQRAGVYHIELGRTNIINIHGYTTVYDPNFDESNMQHIINTYKKIECCGCGSMEKHNKVIYFFLMLFVFFCLLLLLY